MNNLSWYIKRFFKMSFPEISYRLQHKIREKVDKKGYLSRPLDFPKDTQSILSRLFPLFCQVTSESLKSCSVVDKAFLLAISEDILLNRCKIFGIKHDFGKRIDWHLDPKTGNRWPLKFWSEIDIRDGFTIGGPKFVWEVNRLYCLPILGMAFRLSGERRYADKIYSLVEEWIQANPYPKGVNWTSGIELGIRVVNLIVSLSFLEGYEVSDQQNNLINRFLLTHGHHLYRYPSKYSSNNNHAIAEAFALFLIGVYFPHFSEAKKWFRFGKTVLEREVARQILPDGGSYECTTTYLSFVFDFFLFYKLVCDKNYIDYAPIVNERLEQSCEFIDALMDRNGNLPNIGDQDSAVLVNFGLDNLENFNSILNTGAVLFNRPEFRQDNFPDFKTQVLVGDRIKTNGNLSTANTKTACMLFEHSGLAVIRKQINDKEFVFVGNAMPLGMPPLFAHGHLDALSFTLFIDGLEIFIDPGTYLYHSGGKWRRYFRSTAAHNTVRIKETDMTPQLGDFMFGKPYKITENSLNEKDGRAVWQAGHDAYTRLKESVWHIRRVTINTKDGVFHFEDMLKGKGNYLAEQYFHFHPECQVKRDSKGIEIKRESIMIRMTVDDRLNITEYRGSKNPLCGWYSKAFNELEETTSICCKTQIQNSTTLRTTLQIII
jgi:uncharacterized heparinase superfamily protein